MLSDAIRLLEETYSKYEIDGMVIEPEAVKNMVMIFQIWGHEARSLEERLHGLTGHHNSILPEHLVSGKVSILKFRNGTTLNEDTEGGAA